ncbi:MAG: hypothetical protein ACP5U2_16355 [Bryobacteraceae bacterium]
MRRRPMVIAALIVAVLLCQGCLEVSGARLNTPKPDKADQRWIARSCESLWPEAVRMMSSQGFRLVGRDPSGLIASFMWADERRLGRLRATGDLEEFILPEGSGPRDVRNARIEAAVLEAAPKNRGCELRLRISYAAPPGAFGMKRGWTSLPSSGRFEERLLALLAGPERHSSPVRASAGPAAGKPVPLARALPAATPAAPEDGAEASRRTRVVRLESEN